MEPEDAPTRDMRWALGRLRASVRKQRNSTRYAWDVAAAQRRQNRRYEALMALEAAIEAHDFSAARRVLETSLYSHWGDERWDKEREAWDAAAAAVGSGHGR